MKKCNNPLVSAEISARQGKVEYIKFVEGTELTRKESMLALCYYCNNGYRDGIEDCKNDNCPLYGFMPYKGKSLS